ncbi:MAG: class I SAM-dependent methyltransferase [Magnetococcales bacterium]|nr:class I SAM-dependent methyltransferase [Magnetococcales bacterium]
MTGETRHQHWDQVYQQRAVDDVSWYQQRPQIALDWIDQLGLKPEAAIIDVGAGASTLVDHLLALGYRQLTLLDISAAALSITRQRLGEQAAWVEWLATDITQFQPHRSFTLWHDRAVFHFLTDANDRQRYVAALKQALYPSGYLIMATFAVDGPQQCSQLPVCRYDIDQLQHELGPDFTLLATTHERHRTPAGKEQHFMYGLLQFREMSNGRLSTRA